MKTSSALAMEDSAASASRAISQIVHSEGIEITDSFGRAITYLRVSVTELCNLRCQYCMPAEGVRKRSHADMLTEEELLRAVRIAAQLGVTKVRVTGGEPLVKRNILSICRGIADIPGVQELCLTTNGVLLPPLADELRAAGVRRVNLSLDTLDAEKYARITRIGCLDDALRGLDAALSAGFDRVKLNAVLLGGFNDDEIPALAGLTREYPVDVRFIEWMPMGQRPPGAYPLDCGVVLKALPELTALPPDGGVAERYILPGAQGYVGLIRPVSCQFCAGCNRLRLTADGKLKPCLHSGQEFSVRGLDDAAMRAQFLRAIREKPARHAPLDLAHQSEAGRNMNEIGG